MQRWNDYITVELPRACVGRGAAALPHQGHRPVTSSLSSVVSNERTKNNGYSLAVLFAITLERHTTWGSAPAHVKCGQWCNVKQSELGLQRVNLVGKRLLWSRRASALGPPRCWKHNEATIIKGQMRPYRHPSLRSCWQPRLGARCWRLVAHPVPPSAQGAVQRARAPSQPQMRDAMIMLLC